MCARQIGMCNLTESSNQLSNLKLVAETEFNHYTLSIEPHPIHQQGSSQKKKEGGGVVHLIF